MKWRMVFGALAISACLCGQGFGFELLDRLLGLNCRGCGTCGTCTAPECCEVATECCAPEPACCEAPAACEEIAACEEVAACGGCDEGCGDPCCDPCGKRRDLFSGLRGLFDGRGGCNACDSGCNACEEVAACEQACAPEPCEEVACEVCEPACEACEPACEACEPACDDGCGGCDPCGRSKQPIRDALKALDILGLFSDDCCGGCGGCNACEQVADCGGCGGGAPMGDVPPALPPGEEAPLPAPPTADQGASLFPHNSIHQASRSIVRY